MDAKNQPSDYQPGTIGLIIIGIPDSYDPQQLNIFSGTVGKYFPLERNVWLTTEAGVSIANGYKFQFTRQNVETDSWGSKTSNYKVTRESATGLGGMLKADLMWGFSSFAGFGFGVYGNANSVQSSLGCEFKLLLGYINREKKKK